MWYSKLSKFNLTKYLRKLFMLNFFPNLLSKTCNLHWTIWTTLKICISSKNYFIWTRSKYSRHILFVSQNSIFNYLCFMYFCYWISKEYSWSFCWTVSGIGTLWCRFGWWEGLVCSLGWNRFQNWWCSMVVINFLKLSLNCHI